MRRHSGFTLVEVLVVMVLLATIMVAMGSALRTLSMTEVRVDQRLQRNDQVRVAHDFLSAALGRVEAIHLTSIKDGAGKRIQFLAQPDQLMWVGIMPARHGAGGRYSFRLSLEETSGKKSLILRYAPRSGLTQFPAWQDCESLVIAESVEGFLVEAQGLPVDIQTMPTTWPHDWQQGWPVADAIPQRIRLTWADNFGFWPPLVVALLPTLQSQPNYGGFVIGGTVR